MRRYKPVRRSPTLTVQGILLALTLLLSGCSLPTFFQRDETADDAGVFLVYRISAGRGQAGELIRAEAQPDLAADSVELGTAVSLFASPAMGAALTRALPDGVTVEGFGFENGVVTLELSEEYLALPEMRRTLAAFCAVLTVCQLDGVEAVTVTSGGETVFSGLMPEDAFLTAADTDPYIRQLRLYFSDADGRYLVSEYHSLTLEEDASAERYVVEELLRGPNNGELRSAIPAGTVLRSCATDGGVCTVDLSAAFYDGRPDTALGERLAVYSLVDSLTALAEVKSVRILVEGQQLDTYVYLPLSEPFARYEEPIGPVSAPKGELDADLYLALPDLSDAAPLPFRVNGTGYESRAEAVLSELMTAAEPRYPALFPSSASVSEAVVRGSVCTVELTEGFFASIPAQERALAVLSMTRTLCALPEIGSVRYAVGGESAVFDGIDWSGPWNADSDFDVFF